MIKFKLLKFLTHPIRIVFLPCQLHLRYRNINMLNMLLFMSSHQQWLQERQQLLLQNPSFFIVFLTLYSTKEEVPSHICWLQRKKDSHSQYYAIQTLSFHKLTTHYDYFWMQSSFRMKEDLWLVLEAAETQMPVTVQLYNPIPVYIWNRTDWYVWVVQYCICVYAETVQG